MKIFIVIFLILITINLKADNKPIKFIDTDLKLVEQTQYENAKLYKDDKGNDYLTMTFKVTDEGFLIGDIKTPLENFILFPTDKINLTKQDIEDIFLFIKSRDLKNRIK